MTREQIISEINSELAEEFEIEESAIVPDAPIYETLNLDSLSLVDLIGIVQAKYGVLISKTELPGIKTFSNLYDYIDSHVNK
ncbi:MAG: acyl carrier protein [Bacteroidaceae bacterium]|nr:acyl carrier protein [Bacteroidaceae bacterium]